jgi:glycosyltransferase involved in cell wall biosynthesis
MDKPGYLFVVPWDIKFPGGVNHVIMNLHDEMAREGEFAPFIFVSDWSARRPVETVVDGRRTIHLRLTSPWPDGTAIGFLKWLVRAPTMFLRLWRVFRRHRVTVVNAHYPTPDVVPVAILRALHFYRGKLLLSFHGLDLAAARGSGRTNQALWRFLLRHSDAAISCSHAFGKDVEQFARGETEVVVVHNGLDADAFVAAADRETETLPDGFVDREFILAVASLERKKGLDVLLRAFVDVRRTHPKLALVVGGPPFGAAPELRALSAQLGLDDDVAFVGKLPNTQVAALYERARIFCLPSRSEPFGIVLLEAGVFRLPVVASRVGGIPEIIEDGRSGLLVPPDDAPALAEAITRLLDDASFARAAGDRLDQRVRTEFSWTRAYQSYKAVVSRSDGRGVI